MKVVTREGGSYWGVSPSLWQGPLLFCQREGPHHTFQPQEPRDKKQLRGAGSFLPPCSGDSGLRAWQQTPFSSNQISILHTLPNAGWCYRSTAWTPDTLLLPSLATSTSIHQYRTQKFCFFSFICVFMKNRFFSCITCQAQFLLPLIPTPSTISPDPHFFSSSSEKSRSAKKTTLS